MATMLTQARMLDRFLARDRQWDGRFLTGVVTTGIYCLPSCPARRPKPENVRFFDGEAAARAAGLRPCRRCRPDQFYRAVDPDLDLAEGLLARLRAAPGAFPDVAALARAAGIGRTALNDLCRRHFHDTPAAVLLRERVACAARELLAGSRPILDVALDAGFDSSSAFHANFKAETGMTPRAWRGLAAGREFVLALPADFRRADTLAALGRDPDAVDQRVTGNTVSRSLELEGRPAVLTVTVHPATARCAVQGTGRLSAASMATAQGASLALLGLPADVAPFERRARRHAGLARIVARRPGLRMTRTVSVFEALCWAVVGQQVNLPFAFRQRRALFELCGRSVGDLRVHPTPEALAGLDAADLTARQFSGAKADYLLGLAREVAAGRLDVEQLAAASVVRAGRTLLAQRGIGPWSLHYVLMRGCGRQDCVPEGDAGLVAALQQCFALPARPDARRTQQLMAPFAPHRTLAAYHLWQSLGDDHDDPVQ